MHCLRARAYITWSFSGSGSARRAMADHASVKVIMALLRRITVFCNHLPQWLYHQAHQALLQLSDPISGPRGRQPRAASSCWHPRGAATAKEKREGTLRGGVPVLVHYGGWRCRKLGC